MKHSKLRAAVLLWTLFAAAPALAADLRGFAAAGPLGVVLFQECRGGKPAPQVIALDDRTPEAALVAGLEAVRKIMLEAGRPIYVEFEGEVAGKTIRVQRFQRADGTVADCAQPAGMPTGTLLWAAGNDPAWQLVATAAGARLERPGQPPLRLPAAPFVRPAKAAQERVIDAWSAADGGSIRLVVKAGLCTDGRSETAYGALATLRVGSSTYEGCAARF